MCRRHRGRWLRSSLRRQISSYQSLAWRRAAYRAAAAHMVSLHLGAASRRRLKRKFAGEWPFALTNGGMSSRRHRQAIAMSAWEKSKRRRRAPRRACCGAFNVRRRSGRSRGARSGVGGIIMYNVSLQKLVAKRAAKCAARASCAAYKRINACHHRG